MNKYFPIKLLTVILIITVILLTKASFPASAVYNNLIYNVSFQNSDTQITAPTINNPSVDKFLTIEGKTSLSPFFLCLQGPSGEISVYPVEVNNGSFQRDIWLRFGSGTYTIWAGDNEKKFDGSLRFVINNISQEDYRYITPSGYVDSNSPEILKIADSLVTDKLTELQKVKAIYDFVAKTIRYDVSARMNEEKQLNTATFILNSRLGICRDYAFSFAAIARAAGFPTKVVYGDVLNMTTMEIDKHAWNETYINGKWINIDTSWSAGFNPSEDLFTKTHTVTSITIF